MARGRGFESLLRQNCPRLGWGAEPPTALWVPHRQLPTAPGVGALGWVECREHIFLLLIILRIIVYVTMKIFSSSITLDKLTNH